MMNDELFSVLNPMGVDQVGIVVKDIDEAAHHFRTLLGVGPFRVMEWPIEGIDPEGTLLGEPAEWRMKLAFAQAGDVWIELIQPLEGESLFSHFLEEHGAGLHHLRFLVADFDAATAALEAAGIERLSSGTGAHVGSRWAYYDTRELLGGLLIEVRPVLKESESAWATDDRDAES
jgi:catechol 2,3-dioxygenase-like lactoylglutathione lyase family enzyme